MKLKFYLAYVLGVILNIPAITQAQMIVTDNAPYNTANYLINNVFSDGTVQINNVQVFGQAGQYGYFGNGLAAVGMDSGIVLSTWHLGSVSNSPLAPNWGFPAPGNVNNTTGINFGFPWMGTAASNNLLSVSGSVPGLLGANFAPASDVNSACAISFDFIPTQDTMEFKFVFASSEWNTFPCTGFNDVFGFFVSGPGMAASFNSPPGFTNTDNVAFVPGTNIPITISSITHPTQTGSCNQSYNTQYYAAGNSGGLTLSAKTTVLTIQFPVQICNVYNFTMAIANAGDVALQSAVFMEGNSFGGTQPFNAVIEPVYNTIGGDSIIYEGCAGIDLTFERNDTLLLADTIPLDIFGSAIPGLDTDPIPDSLFFAAGQDSISLYFDIPNDGLIEGPETLFIAINDTNIQIGCGSFEGDTLRVIIEDAPEIVADPTTDTVMCTDPPVNLMANTTSGIGPFDFQWSTNDSVDSIYVNTPTATTEYYVTITDACSLFTIVDTATVVIENPPTSINAASDTITCEDPGALISVSVTDPMPGLVYQWNSGQTLDNFYQVNPFGSTDYIVTVTQACAGYFLIDTFELVLDNPPFTTSTDDITIDCTTGLTDISVEVSYTTPNFQFEWNTGVMDSVQTVNPLNTTIYYISVTDACDALTIVDSVTVFVENIPLVSSSQNGSIPCIWDSTEVGPTVYGGYYPYFYSWSTGEFDSAVVLSYTPNSMSHFVTITDVCGQEQIEEIDVIIQDYNPIEIIPYENDSVTCLGDVYKFETPNVIGGSGRYAVSWDNWVTRDDVISGVANNSQTFTVQVADLCNLDSTSSEVSVIVPRYDQLSLNIPSDTITCSGDEIELLATVRHGAGGYEYYWSTGSNDEFITVEPIEQLTNRYTVTVIDQCGSSVSGEINVETGSPEAFFDGEFIDGVNLMLRNKSNDAISYEWNFDDGNTSNEEHPWHKYEEDGTYSVRLTAIDENGCRDNAMVVFESPLRTFIPNAFTPNGDGKNDVFKIEGTGFSDNENITRFNIVIFNRWGEVVFSSNNPDFVWDANNEENGIYVYQLTIEGLGSQKIEKTGSIQILF